MALLSPLSRRLHGIARLLRPRESALSSRVVHAAGCASGRGRRSRCSPACMEAGCFTLPAATFWRCSELADEGMDRVHRLKDRGIVMEALKWSGSDDALSW